MNNRNIILTGMPGAGKSTIGVLLAKAMQMQFIDTDLLIQQQEKRFLQDIINEDGLERFLDIEEKIILKMDTEKHIIATGGSVVYSETSMSHLKANGVVIYLKLRFKEIEKRIRNITSRGIVMNRSQNLLDLYNERVPLYEKYADITVICSGKHMETVVNEIIIKNL